MIINVVDMLGGLK